MNEVLEANKELGELEAPFYDRIHSEIFNKTEQERLKHYLDFAMSKISSSSKRALDVGCGTGNLTMKLLELGFEVTAVDLCQPYLDILKKKAGKYIEEGKLKIICKNIEEIIFEEEFDFVCIYSALHHFPDYLGVVKKMISWLKKGGILYIDHESCNEEWKWNKTFTRLYEWSCGLLNAFSVYIIRGIKRKDIKFDYSKADFHTSKNDFVDHEKIRDVLTNNMKMFSVKAYLSKRTHIPNPMRFLFWLVYKYDTILWIAKK